MSTANTAQLRDTLRTLAALATEIKRDLPPDSVSVDALFMVLCQHQKAALSGRKKAPEPAPAWLGEIIAANKGRRLTVGELMMLAGKLPASKAQKNAVGAWLRDSGRFPKQSGGKSLFTM